MSPGLTPSFIFECKSKDVNTHRYKAGVLRVESVGNQTSKCALLGSESLSLLTRARSLRLLENAHTQSQVEACVDGNVDGKDECVEQMDVYVNRWTFFPPLSTHMSFREKPSDSAAVA